MARDYYPETLAFRTGAEGATFEQLRPEFRDALDSTGCLDAPQLMPRGSVRAIDCQRITLADAAVMRRA